MPETFWMVLMAHWSQGCKRIAERAGFSKSHDAPIIERRTKRRLHLRVSKESTHTKRFMFWQFLLDIYTTTTVRFLQGLKWNPEYPVTFSPKSGVPFQLVPRAYNLAILNPTLPPSCSHSEHLRLSQDWLCSSWSRQHHKYIGRSQTHQLDKGKLPTWATWLI